MLATAVQDFKVCKTHNEKIRVYYKYKNVEKYFLRNIHTALYDKYIKHLVHYDTGLIDDNMPMVLDSLFTNYGKVQSEEVKSKEAEVITLTFIPADLMATLYRPIENLQKLTTAANIPYLSAQQL